jgi:hypothetical protein
MITLVLDERLCEPGQTLRGMVRWEWDDRRAERNVKVRLLWYTEGKGTEDCGVVGEHAVDASANSGQDRFTFALPPFPWTYAGHLLSVVWAVEALVEPGDDVCRETLVCAPGRETMRPW